jgi:MFS family permease
MNHSSTPRDVFAHLLAIGMLYVSVVAFLSLIFQYINIWLPDQLSYQSFNGISSIVRGATAALIVVWPVYIYLMRLLRKDEVAHPEKHDIRIRKWLFNFTMFVSAITIIVALIIVIGSFLNGELTARFFLKSATVLIVAVVVFGYYRWELKRDAVVESKLPEILAYATSSVLVVSIVAGFFIVGTPADQRDRRLDSERESDLQELQWQIINYWQDTERLPENLSVLNDGIGFTVVPTDPETGETYEYYIKGDLTFELCADFARASDEQASQVPRAELIDQNWQHQSGRTCFERTIDPERYPTKGEPIIVR